jgi:hypothetical protein
MHEAANKTLRQHVRGLSQWLMRLASLSGSYRKTTSCAAVKSARNAGDADG